MDISILAVYKTVALLAFHTEVNTEIWVRGTDNDKSLHGTGKHILLCYLINAHVLNFLSKNHGI